MPSPERQSMQNALDLLDKKAGVFLAQQEGAAYAALVYAGEHLAQTQVFLYKKI